MEWPQNLMTFLGILLDGIYHILSVPEDKRVKTLNMLMQIVHKKKATVKELQQLAGVLNFLNRAIVPRRPFTRRMYSKFSGIIDQNGNKIVNTKLKQHHHIRLDMEFKEDCRIWIKFLSENNNKGICRPFVDVEDRSHTSITLDFYTDTAKGLAQGGLWKTLVLCQMGEKFYQRQ